MIDTPRAWLTRSGRNGERDEGALATGVTPDVFGAAPDLSTCRGLDDVRVVVAAEPNASSNAVGNFAAQLWALAGSMRAGDYLAQPREATSQIAVGSITGNYAYLTEEPDPAERQVRPVGWLRTDVPRSQVKQDGLQARSAFEQVGPDDYRASSCALTGRSRA